MDTAPPAQALATEYTEYLRLKPGLLDRAGQFVVIVGVRVIGVYPSRSAALDAGYGAVPLGTPFLAHKIQAVEPVHVICHAAP